MELLTETIGEASEAQEGEVSKANLFFIKSKHAFPVYRNHDYFQRQPIQLQNSASPVLNRSSSFEKRKNSREHLQTAPNEFVEQPKPYGIDNTYQYLRQLHTHSQVQSVQAQSLPPHMQQPSTKRRVLQRLTLPGLAKREPLPQQNIAQSSQNRGSKRGQDTGNTELDQVKQVGRAKAEEIVHFQYFKAQEKALDVNFDILPLLKATFRKGKVAWSGMLQPQWNILRSAIVEVASKRRQPADFKDIITLGSISALIQYYEVSNKPQALEAVRYLMVASEQVYCYQLQKLKEQILASLQQLSKMQTFPQTILIFDADLGQKIKSIHQLLELNSHKSRFICGGEGCLENYRRAEARKEQSRQQAKQLAGWRRAVKGQYIPVVKPKPMTASRYQEIFSCTRQRRLNHPSRSSRSKHSASLQQGPFLDPQKLTRQPDIFE